MPGRDGLSPFAHCLLPAPEPGPSVGQGRLLGLSLEDSSLLSLLPPATWLQIMSFLSHAVSALV